MRTLLAFVVLCPALVLGQAQMRVLSQGREIGTARLTQKLLDGGGKQVVLIMDLAVAERKVTVRQISNYDEKGFARHKFQETIATPGPARTSVIATIMPDRASVVSEQGGTTRSVDVAFPGDGLRDDPSEFWFLRGRPQPGTKVERYRFDLTALAWKKTTVEYVGPRPVDIGGRRVAAHLVRTDEASVYLDDAGLPLVLETKEFRLERTEVN